VGSNEPALSSKLPATNPAPVVQEVAANNTTVASSSSSVAKTTTDHVSKAANVTVTPVQTARGPGPVTAEPATAAGGTAAAPKSPSPFTKFRNFLSNLFGTNQRQTQGEQQRNNTTASNSTTPQKTAKTSTPATTNNTQ